MISIIMPAYNSFEYMKYSVASVLAQSYTDFELIIVDDFSDVDLKKLIFDFFFDARIKVYRNTQNIGVAGSRNRGIRNASGEFLAFLHSDDIWHKNKLELHHSFLTKSNAYISHTSYTFIDERGRDLNGISTAKDYSSVVDYLKTTGIGLSTVLVDRKFFSNIFFPESAEREDFELWIKLLNDGYAIIALDIPLVKYRVRKQQISGNKFKMAFKMAVFYSTIDYLPAHFRIWCYVCYVFNAFYKRIIGS